MTLLTIDQVVTMLADRATALAAELLPRGRRDGPEWRVGSLAGEPGKSMGVRLVGNRAGVWCDFGTGDKGDALDLVAAVLFAGDKRQALAWSRRWLGLESGDPTGLQTARRAVQDREDRSKAEIERARRAAHRLWMGAQERIAGTPVEDYLGGRGIDFAALQRQPRAIRYHPAVYNAERDDRLPAMVTAITRPGVPFTAVHRTWLEQAGPADWRKARVSKPKMALGSFRGGYMPIWRGASGKPIADAPDGEIVDITEGIEDALSVAMACPECRVLAAISVSNIGNLMFPPQIRTVRLWRDNDHQAIPKPGLVDTRDRHYLAFDRAVSALLARKLEVLAVDPGQHFKDANDLLMHVYAADCVRQPAGAARAST